MNVSRKTRLSDRDARYGRIQHNRIQKLLLSEYCEFSETILVESPFAETTRNGRGVRQVALGLTPTRLIVAADILQRNPGFLCPSGLDTSIETFELVSLYPLEYVTLSVFRRRHRRTLKARFVDGRVYYYELGGMQRRITWKIWCRQIEKLLACKRNGSSLTETTVASSSSSSTLYLLSPRIEIEHNHKARRKEQVFRVWARYQGGGDYFTPTWTEKNLYLGPSYNELMNGRHYAPIPVRFAGASLDNLRNELEDHTSRCIAYEKSCHSWPCESCSNQTNLQRVGGLCDVLFTRNHNAHRRDYITTERQIMQCKKESKKRYDRNCDGNRDKCTRQCQRKLGASLKSKVSRFGFGVPEKCSSGLVLGPYRGPGGDPAITESTYIESKCAYHCADPCKLMDSGVAIWERDRERDCCSSLKSQRHPRRYALSSAAHFFHALGPWSVQPGERESVQTFRSPSTVNIRKQSSDPDMRFPVSRRQLTASVSCAALTSDGSSLVSAVTRGRVILFWTPEYWYRPQSASTAYRELRRHLTSLQDFRRGKEKERTRRKFFRRRKDTVVLDDTSETTITGKSSSLLERVLSINGARKRDRKSNENTDLDRSTTHLRKLLRMTYRITVWDLDSTTIATQLTMIDRDLFIRIPATEIELLLYQRSSRNTPNLGAWIAFSHRIACLTVSEILAIKKLDMRARIMARFISVADKCFELGNFQSCRSILAGLQAPPIYRLHTSWSYLRTYHASRYELMRKLSRIYKNPRCSKYRRAWTAVVCNPPCMPYVDHFLIKVLGLNGLNEIYTNFTSTKRRSTRRIIAIPKSSSLNNNLQNLHLKQNRENLIESKQCLAKRVFTKMLIKMRFMAHRSVDIQNNISSWTLRQRYLARKFFRRWRIIMLESRIRKEQDEKSKNRDSRREHILDVAAWLTDCQKLAKNYNFALHSFACEFLLKARYREDRENFFISLKLEPPKTI